MKEFRTAFIMTMIPLAFGLVLEGSHSTDPIGRMAYTISGLILFAFSMYFWSRTIKLIKAEEAKESEDRNSLTTAINNLVNEIRKDRDERTP